ncbi:hypothetical protein KEM48_006299 [Puccinia striiformis f. sp. tritici PST-130]|nr:hypothetical protein KEM48_006299 [Puccinia striiformis f. sp. tritici PST-130]
MSSSKNRFDSPEAIVPAHRNQERNKMIRSICLSLIVISLLIATASGSAFPNMFVKDGKTCYHFSAVTEKKTVTIMSGKVLPLSLGPLRLDHPEKLRTIKSESTDHMMIITHRSRIPFPPGAKADLLKTEVIDSGRIFVVTPWDPAEVPTGEFRFKKLLDIAMDSQPRIRAIPVD